MTTLRTEEVAAKVEELMGRFERAVRDMEQQERDDWPPGAFEDAEVELAAARESLKTALTEALSSPEAEALDALKRDGERYRFLKDKTSGRTTAEGAEFVFPVVRPVGDLMRGSVAGHLDAAIDTALSRSLVGVGRLEGSEG
jgi:hypothetical protein